MAIEVGLAQAGHVEPVDAANELAPSQHLADETLDAGQRQALRAPGRLGGLHHLGRVQQVQVEAGRDVEECRKVAYAISHSPLIKTAFFASDPNLGRILAAIGYAGVENLDVNAMQLYLGDVLVAENGGRAQAYQEEQGAAVMKEPEILVRVVLNRGEASATVWTCDFSYDYVKINADYRS